MAPVVNLFFKSKDKIKFPSQKLCTTYKILQIFFNLNFGFIDFSRTKLKFYGKYITLCISFIASLSALICTSYGPVPQGSVWFWFDLPQYLLFTVILFGAKHNLYKEYRKIGVFDTKFKIQRTTNKWDNIIVIVFIVLSFLFEISLFFTYHFIFHLPVLRPLWALFVYVLIIHFKDMICVTNAFAFYTLNDRLAILLNKTESGEMELLTCLNLYKSFADIVDNIKGFFDPLFAVALLFRIPSMMLSVYQVAQHILTETLTITDMYVVTVTAILPMLFCITPALLAGKLTTKTKKLTVILHDKWMLEQDPVFEREIQQFIEYVKARPLTFFVYGVIPLNVHLLSMIVHFCVTYLIVMLQFTIK